MDEEKREIPEEVQEIDTGFMREEIKTPPVSRRQMLKRLLEMAVVGAVFGAVACIIFLLLEPLINRALFPQEETTVQEITLPEETAQEELTPEEMQEKEREKEEEETARREALIKEEIDHVLAEMPMDPSEYQRVYSGMKKLADEKRGSFVQVSVIRSDTDWLDSVYEQKGNVSGAVISKNSGEIEVLVLRTGLAQEERIEVQFNGGVTAEAHLLGEDRETGISVLGVSPEGMTKEQLAGITAAALSDTQPDDLTGVPVIAVGNPAGVGSMAFGVINGTSAHLDLYDADFQQLTTDIYGSSSASGFLMDLDGQTVGIVDMKHKRSDMPNSLTALSIAQLKPLITALSKGQTKVYLGIRGTDIPEAVRKEQDMPNGVYIAGTATDSPAMNSGMQTGDIITAAEGKEISCYADLIPVLYELEPGQSAGFEIRRKSGNGYQTMTLTVTF